MLSMVMMLLLLLLVRLALASLGQVAPQRRASIDASAAQGMPVLGILILEPEG